jgi:hypothetical protein
VNHFSANMHASRCRPAMADIRTRVSPTAAPSHEKIAKLAYSYWEARGRQGGSAVEDWLRAERELRERSARAGIG